ncbi:DUF4286 family protein [Novosphingobium taihuense]|uniref:EthD domain-containing protein n=1 Tax=Novosphingobium taihuense TaxID=260085 RepID=A0A7W7ADF6_9SPHN|nr:DUF4286 family protein [Novosphingobium taihuense]MBB4615040.1 hypothetical protein [Novosphingobium taihuense]TWH79273.1 hypothetical protein IQ25_03994 [Novosphingobium taihuense]
MARYKLVAFSNAAEGRDDDFNTWYDQQHLPDVCAIPGFISAERFVCAGEGPHKYMAIYEIETDDFEGMLAEFAKRPGTDLMPISDALDFTTAQVGFWQPAKK